LHDLGLIIAEGLQQVVEGVCAQGLHDSELQFVDVVVTLLDLLIEQLGQIEGLQSMVERLDLLGESRLDRHVVY
jgi:hypothetical protein